MDYSSTAWWKRPLLFPLFRFKGPTQAWYKFYKYYILILTFFCYTTYHCSRKPITVIKAQLHHNCSKQTNPDPNDNSTTWCDWKPFDQDNFRVLFGELDYGYLGAYAFAMFFSGWIAERMSLRYFLFLGMTFSGLLTIAFGLAKPLQIHSYLYFLLIQIVTGIFQSSGWPGVVALVGNWSGRSKRGLIMGIWNSHTSIGNIAGSLIAARFVQEDWSFSFIVPGLMIIFMGFVVLLTCVPHPSELGYQGTLDEQLLVDDDSVDNDQEASHDESGSEHNEEQSLESLDPESTSIAVAHSETDAISFFRALTIPGVIEFSMCLFFAKLISYTFLYWLPFYLSMAFKLGPGESGDYSTIFDVGGIIGGILAGSLSDHTGMRAATSAGMLVVTCAIMPFFQTVASLGTNMLILALFITGLFVNGPYALITTAVSADLGTHPSLHGNSAALATVTAIIDGTGSIGAALGPYLVGLIASDNGGNNWDGVFGMLLVCCIFALLMLSRLVKKEIFGDRSLF